MLIEEGMVEESMLTEESMFIEESMSIEESMPAPCQARLRGTIWMVIRPVNHP
jgi:hypothetical protein